MIATGRPVRSAAQLSLYEPAGLAPIAATAPASAGRADPTQPFGFYEFFAGGGMARAGLGPRWRCLFANDFDHKKSATYVMNWGAAELKTGDVRSLEAKELPGEPGLVWASFPCQDLSLAGMGAGLRGDRSGTFWPFWKLMEQLRRDGRGPRVLVLENVCGTLSSHAGKDFAAIAGALAGAGYRYGAVIVDAACFVPHSRPRLFVIGAADGVEVPDCLLAETAQRRWHPAALRAAYERLERKSKDRWLWWKLPMPQKRSARFADLIEEDPASVRWHTAEETDALLAMMSPVHMAKVKEAQAVGTRQVGTVYKRTRCDDEGQKVQRAEVRFDEVAGCLRTPAGGSSRQLILVIDGPTIRSRLISSRETARLMGLPDCYCLPDNYNEAYHLTGDGVVVPVVRFLADQIIEPILQIDDGQLEAVE